jgi:GntR family transcriptional regulator
MFEIDLKSRKTIYEQVTDNLKEQILAGVIKHDEKLPSVRELSKALTVNPNTVQKSFRELERQGYIYTVTGVGAFAHERSDIEPDARFIEELTSRLADDIRELYFAIPDPQRILTITEEVIAHLKQLVPVSEKRQTSEAGRTIRKEI